MQETLPVLYQDPDIVVIDKPSGLLVHKSLADRHENRYAMKILRNQLGQWVYPVHRLDKPTSGVLVFALSEHIARGLAEQFQSRQVRKTYLAVVRGRPPLGGIIDHPIRESAMFKNSVGKFERKMARESRTLFHRLATVELQVPVDRYPVTRYSLLACYPKTGRQHQIRRHLKHIAHPIIGDVRYGKGVHNRFFEREYQLKRLMLMAKRIEFVHPSSGKPVCVDAGLGNEFQKLIDAFGWVMPAKWC
ncbi:MAG: pseudouridylate synthase [Proteobacteria bacterium]|nr:MAG: pseudouridylate synthase [Pseudomonadota bacterium]PIE40054.1 MAG: pseudouridylate synthase [Gammaproteobacteria bacterium]